MSKKQYAPEFREQILLKARTRGQRTLADIATENNLALGTLKGWIKESNKVAQTLSQPLPATPIDLPAKQYNAGQRLQALQESHALTGLALAAWCREKGLFEHQLQQWRHAICSMDSNSNSNSNSNSTKSSHAEQAALRKLSHEHAQLKRELLRKDKALAETAALLVLQKKFQALWATEAK